VNDLADALRLKGCKVWYADSELRIGDSLSSRIEEGLRRSKRGIVVLSRHFFGKRWTQKELGALHAKVVNRSILPVWHGVSEEEVRSHYPLLADILAVRSSEGMDIVVSKLLDAMRE